MITEAAIRKAIQALHQRHTARVDEIDIKLPKPVRSKRHRDIALDTNERMIELLTLYMKHFPEVTIALNTKEDIEELRLQNSIMRSVAEGAGGTA